MAFHFTAEENLRIEAAVADAEADTSGEIVACVMQQSDAYEEGYLRGALVFATAAMLLVLSSASLYDGWRYGWVYTLEGAAAVVFSTGVLGAVLARLVPGMRRFFIGRGRLADAVRLQAFRTFVQEEVFATKDRTGILIFVSVFERRVEVMADGGISKVVPQSEWDQVVKLISSSLVRGEAAVGFEQAVQACGRILRQYGVDVRNDNPNELSNEVRLRSPRD